ncbi:hypothetical protein IFM47457_06750 [Aspergillus lentulus]|nr:hypothetical protein IFM47457_06750 [Aspergillus lentulus]
MAPRNAATAKAVVKSSLLERILPPNDTPIPSIYQAIRRRAALGASIVEPYALLEMLAQETVQGMEVLLPSVVDTHIAEIIRRKSERW